MVETARVRRSPKFAAFLLLGAALGVLVALILTFAFGGAGQESTYTGMIYSSGQIFGFLLLGFVPAGVALGGVTALILDRTIGRRTREVHIERERIQGTD